MLSSSFTELVATEGLVEKNYALVGVEVFGYFNRYKDDSSEGSPKRRLS